MIEMGFNVKLITILSIFAMLKLSVATPADTSDEQFHASLGSFSQNLFGELFKTNSHTNIVISPFAIQTCLAMTRMGADGETATEMDMGLGFSGQTPESVADNYNTLLAKYANGDILKVANKVYVMANNELNDNFNEVLSKKFLSTPESIDFEQATDAAKSINQWVETKTNHKIKDIIDPDSLSTDTGLLLLSAVHFKAMWKEPFPEEETIEFDFYTDDTNSVKVQMMNVLARFEFGILEKLKSRIVRMPFKDSDLSMVVIIPDDRTGLSALEEKLRTVSLKSLKNKMDYTSTQIYLPKFEDEFQIELTDTLKEMGMNQMFTRADFGKMLKSSQPLYVSKVVHKTYISVNEMGCEAAGVAEVEGGPRMLPEFFIANHPFYYAIVNDDFVPLFQGTVVKF